MIILYLLLQRIEENPWGVFEKEGSVREAESLSVGSGEGESGSQWRLAVGAHVWNKGHILMFESRTEFPLVSLQYLEWPVNNDRLNWKQREKLASITMQDLSETAQFNQIPAMIILIQHSKQ